MQTRKLKIIAVLVAFLAQLAGAVYLFSKGENTGATAALAGTIVFAGYLASKNGNGSEDKNSLPPKKD